MRLVEPLADGVEGIDSKVRIFSTKMFQSSVGQARTRLSVAAVAVPG